MGIAMSQGRQTQLIFESLVEEFDLSGDASSDANGKSVNGRNKTSATRASGEPAPMLKHYLELKQKYPDYILLYQVGDFYEVFYEDAKIAADVLGIRLTSRNKEQPNPVPMCGVPVHALDTYLPKLIDEGLRCVVMSQADEEAPKKGMVKREISRIITPGIRYEGDGLNEKQHNYLAAACMGSRCSGAICYVDVSTGQLHVQEIETCDELIDVIGRINPSELLLPSTLYAVKLDRTEDWVRDTKQAARLSGAQIVARPFERASVDDVRSRILQRCNSFGRGSSGKSESPTAQEVFFQQISEVMPDTLTVVSVVLDYVCEVSFGRGPCISEFSIDEKNSCVVVDPATRRNLELVVTAMDGSKKNSLLNVIDTAKTPMGSRLLKDWILSPSLNRQEIEGRLSAVQELVDNHDALENVRATLAKIGDLDRQVSRLSSGRIVPRDFGGVRDSIGVLPEVANLLFSFRSIYFVNLAKCFDVLSDVYELLNVALLDDLPIRLSEGGVIREGYDTEIDHLRSIRTDGRQWLARLEENEKNRTGINGLKIRYNNVFGYFIEITKTNLSKVPSDYERKQTLANAERFVTPSLKEFEASILSAKSRQFELEKEKFLEIRERVLPHAGRIQNVSRLIATLDVIAAFARNAREFNYCRPEILEDGISANGRLEIIDGRHPVVELVRGAHNFVSNDTKLDREKRRFVVLTGPNMGGKSTYLRQVGLIQILAQAGSFVPARRACLNLVDRVFTRIGGADDITRGDSTFMVEMREASTIVRKGTARSLVLIDEIGRGTATTDGLAIATAIAEWLHDSVRCYTIFATHFHELVQFGESREAAFCMSVGIVEKGKDIVFTHKIEERPGDRSYGIEVARLAGLPEALLRRASVLLDLLEGESNSSICHLLNVSSTEGVQTNFAHNNFAQNNGRMETMRVHPVVERINELVPNRMTPIEALAQLAQLKELVEEDRCNRSRG